MADRTPQEQAGLERLAADVDNWFGQPERECGEHRTVGPHRAWCFDCTEWCYSRPGMECKGCELPVLRAQMEAVRALHVEVDMECAECHTCWPCRTAYALGEEGPKPAVQRINPRIPGLGP